MKSRPYSPRNHSLEGLALTPSCPEALVLLLHGYGANGADLMTLGEVVNARLPSVGFIAPDGPGRLPFGANSRYWFELDARLQMADLDRGVQGARPLLIDYIDALLNDFKLPAEKMLLLGFSQGGMMALEIAPRLERPLGHVMSLSSLLVGAERLPGELKSRPPIFLGHGTTDPVVPFSALSQGERVLKAHGFTVAAQAYQGVGHGIPSQAIETLANLAQTLI